MAILPFKSYWNTVCSSGDPVSKKAHKSSEKEPRSTIKMIKGLEHLPFKIRLRHLEAFFSLEKRYPREGMIETCTIMPNVEKEKRENYFSPCI